MQLGIVGATGAVGEELVTLVAEAFADGRLSGPLPKLFASGQSTPEPVEWDVDETLEVKPYSAAAARGLDWALVAVPDEAAPKIVAELRSQGTRVIDLSRTGRAERPLVGSASVPFDAPVRSLPGADAWQLATALRVLSPWSPRAVRVTTMRAASAVGRAGVQELAEATGRLLNGMEPETNQLPHRLAFNAIPQTGRFDGADTQVELDLVSETRRLLGQPALPITATAVFGPWFYGHLQVVHVELGTVATTDEVRAAFAATAGVKVLDQPAEAIYPLPSLVTGDTEVHVGRIRPDTNGIQFITTIDNVRAIADAAVQSLVAATAPRA